MEFKLSINLDNAAFQDNPSELADILRSLANRLESDNPLTGLDVGDFTNLPIRDSNGNRVGVANIVFDD